MKAPRCLASSATRCLTLLAASTLLVQCTIPSREAWQYIQSNGLINYWAYTSQQHSSPPFRTGGTRSQRYASSQRYAPSSHYNTAPPSNWFSWWGSGMPNRIPYSYNNRYYAPAPSRSSGGSSGGRSAPRPQLSPTPNVKLPVDDPSSAPQVAGNPSAAPSTGSVSLPPTPKPAGDLPFGSPVPGRPNMVNSPYAGKTQLVDVSGMGVGQTVKCPYTGKLFKVPSAQQAANNTAPKVESKLDAPKFSDEPKKP